MKEQEVTNIKDLKKGKKKLKTVKKDAPLFSIIVLTYYQRHLLEDCIDSILEQDYPNLELVVCDDCSADFDVDEVRTYIEKHKEDNLRNIVVYKQPENVGTVRNAQKGVELSSGKFFKLHAGDDLLYNEEVISQIREQFNGPDVELVAGRSIACQRDGTMTDHYFPANEAVNSMMEADAAEQFRLIGGQAWGEFVNAPAVFWRRSLFDKIGGFDLSYKYTEDWPMWLKITRAGHRIHMVNEPFVIYRYGGISNDASSVNLTLGKVHYDECIRMFREEVLPVYETMGNRRKIVRTKHCIRCLEIRKDVEGEWKNWHWGQQLLWKAQNVDFLLLSWFYRKVKHNILMDKRICLRIMGVCAMLSFFHVDIWPGLSCDALWSWVFAAAAVWCAAKVAIEYGIKSLRKVLNIKKRNHGNGV